MNTTRMVDTTSNDNFIIIDFLYPGEMEHYMSDDDTHLPIPGQSRKISSCANALWNQLNESMEAFWIAHGWGDSFMGTDGSGSFWDGPTGTYIENAGMNMLK